MTTTVSVPPPEPVNGTRTSLEKIESFLSDATYKEALENSVNYNTRLCIERRLRLPFIDTQTGVAQNHSALFMNRRQRIPGLLPGQIYTYPRQRWRKKRRQYLTMNARAFARAADHLLDGESDMHSISTMENPALQDTDSKDSQLLLKDEVSKEWFYDEADMLEIDAYDEPDPESDLDYEETYSKRRKGRRGTGRGRSGTDSPSTPGRKKGAGRGRKKAAGHSFEPTPGDPDKPFACERTPGRNKARQTPGMPPSPVMGTAGPPPQSQAPTNLPPSLPPLPATVPTDDPPMPVLMPEKSMEPIVLNPGPSVPVEGITSPVAPAVDDTKKPTISPYCDFCLGYSRENKKTGTQEDLVSCSDCGRSGKNVKTTDDKINNNGKKGRKKKA